MTIQSKIAATLLAGLALAAPTASGQVSGTRITDVERNIIQRYFDTRPRSTEGTMTRSDMQQGDRTQARSTEGRSGTSKDKGKGKGQAQDRGEKEMPRGISKKLERGGTLPPGIKKTRMPADLARELPRRPANQELTIVEDNVVLLEKTTGRILDIVRRTMR